MFLLYPIILLELSVLDGFSKPWAKRHCVRNHSPNKISKLRGTKIILFFFLLLKTAKIKQYSSYCFTVLMCVEDSGFLWWFELEFHMPPNTESGAKSVPPQGCVCSREEGPLCQSCLCRAQCNAQEELRVPQAFHWAGAVQTFSCWSFTLVRTNLSTDYSPCCKLPAPDVGFSGLL